MTIDGYVETMDDSIEFEDKQVTMDIGHPVWMKIGATIKNNMGITHLIQNVNNEFKKWADVHCPGYKMVYYNGPMGVPHSVRIQFQEKTHTMVFKLKWM